MLATMHACTPPMLTPEIAFPSPDTAFSSSHRRTYRLSSIVALPSSSRSDSVLSLLRFWNEGRRTP